MTRRAAICESIVSKLNTEGLLDGVKGFSNGVHPANIVAKNIGFNDITDYPYITVSPGPETRTYESSHIIWKYLTVYIRVYVQNDNATEELEAIISDIEDTIDKDYKLGYTVLKDGVVVEEGAITDIEIPSIITDEGALAPNAFGEITLEIRYDNHRVL